MCCEALCYLSVRLPELLQGVFAFTCHLKKKTLAMQQLTETVTGYVLFCVKYQHFGVKSTQY